MNYWNSSEPVVVSLTPIFAEIIETMYTILIILKCIKMI